MNQAIEWATKATRDQGLDRLQHVQNTLGRAQHEIEYLLEVYESAESDADRAQALNHCIEFMLPFLATNLRMDLLAQSQGALLVLARTGRTS